MVGADIFFGLSAKGALTPEMVKTMAPNPIIFAMANPDPEITPEDARKARDDVIIATGRSDYPNQVNNVLGFPYIFRGALDVRAKTINMEMKIAAAQALADLAREDVPDEVAAAYRGARPRFGREYIIPVPFDPRLIHVVPIAVAKAAMASGVARRPIVDLGAYKAQLSARRDPIAGAMQRIIERVRRMPKRVVFAEGEEEQVIRAAYSFVNQGLGTAILVGREERVRAAAEASGLDLADKGIEVHNARLSQRNALYAQFLYERLQRKGYLFRDCQRLINQDRNYFGAAMVAQGDADAMVTGRHPKLFDRSRGGAARHRRQTGPSRRRRIDHHFPRPPDPRRRYCDHRNADGGGSGRHRDRGRWRRAAPGLRAARCNAGVLELRASAWRAHSARAGGGPHSRTRDGSTSNTTARWAPTSRSTGSSWRPIRSAGSEDTANVLVMPAFHSAAISTQDAAGTRRRDGDRTSDRRIGKAGADRHARREGLRYRQHGGDGELQYRRVRSAAERSLPEPDRRVSGLTVAREIDCFPGFRQPGR